MTDPWTHALPPDTRAVGTGDPANDENANVDALTALGAGFSVLNPAYAGGADPTGTNDSGPAVAACVTAAVAARMPVLIPGGTYKLTAPLDWRIAGLVVQGAGKQNTILQMATANTQIVRLAGQHQHISGLQFKYASQQPSGNTSAIAVSFGDDTAGSCFAGIYEDLYIVQACTGMAVDPSVASVGGLFSCTLRSIRISQNGGLAAINIFASNGTGANITGNKWEAVYVSNNWNGSPSTWGAHPVAFQGCDNDYFSVINIEHGNAFNSDVLAFTNCAGTVIGDLHIEAVPTSGNPGFGQILCNASTLLIRSMCVRDPTYTAIVQNPLVRFANGSTGNNVTIDGLDEVTAGGTWGTHPYADFGTSAQSTLQVSNVTATQVTAMAANGGGYGNLLAVSTRQPSLDAGPAGALAETYPRQHATVASGTLTSGTLVVRAISLPKGLLTSSCTFVTNSTAKTGGTHGWYVLLDSARKVLAVTADQTDPATVWGTINTPYTLNWATPFTTVYDGMYYVGVMVAETSGTMPTFAVLASVAAGLNGTVLPVLAGTSSAGQTTPPALGATMAAVSTVGTDNLYGYIS